MRVNYFDMGLYRATELRWVVEEMLPALGIEDWQAYGFEAYKPYFDKLQFDDPRVHLYNLAICGHDGPAKLYLVPGSTGEGHSIWPGKINVKEDTFVTIDGIRFSSWLIRTVPDFRDHFNVLRANIEGAEWYLFRDLVDNHLLKYFSLIAGTGSVDVAKVKGLDYGRHRAFMQAHSVECIPFDRYHKKSKTTFFEVLKKRYADAKSNH